MVRNLAMVDAPSSGWWNVYENESSIGGYLYGGMVLDQLPPPIIMNGTVFEAFSGVDQCSRYSTGGIREP